MKHETITRQEMTRRKQIHLLNFSSKPSLLILEEYTLKRKKLFLITKRSTQYQSAEKAILSKSEVKVTI